MAPYIIAFGLIGFLRHAFGPSDEWVRMASGRLVLEELSVPGADPFSFTVPGREWIDSEWLPGVVWYLLYSVDWELVVALTAVLSLAPFAIMHRYAVHNGSSPLATTGIIAVAIASAWRNYTARPTVISPLMFAVLLILIDLYRKNPPAVASLKAFLNDRRIIAILILMLAWVNIHAGFLIGIAVLAAWSAASLLDRRDLRVPLAVLLASVLLTLLNPYGIDLPQYTVRAVFGDSPDRAYIEEWLSPDFHNPLNWPMLSALALVAYLGLRQTDNFRRLLLIGTMVASFISMRHQPFFAISLVFALAPLLDQVTVPRYVPTVARLIAIPLIFTAVVLYVGTISVEPTLRSPTGGLAYLNATCPSERVIASTNFSSWLVYERYPVFIDGRSNQVYPSSLLRDYFKFDRLEPGWDKVPEKYGVDVVMFPKDHRVVGALEDLGWTAVFEGDVEVIVARGPEDNVDEALPCQPDVGNRP